MSVWTRFAKVLAAFREAFLVSTPAKEDDYNSYAARRLRYDINWSLYEGTAYRNVHSWSTAYKNQFALYKWMRSVRNPAHLISDFQQSHIFGGPLDVDAGSGGSIPIVTDNDLLREAIAELWKWSNWTVNKDTLTLLGAVLGDVGLRVVDDVMRERVYLDIVHPSNLVDVVLDPFGNVKGYTFEEQRDNAVYTEVVSRDGDLVVYETFKNGKPFAWSENGDVWENAYTFVPFVFLKHVDVGLPWGWSEFHPAAGRIREIDELTSMLSDHLRKVINPLWLMKGIKEPGSGFTTTTPTTATPEPDREEIRALWNVSTDSKAEALITTLDISAVGEHIDRIMSSLEADYPEIRPDMVTPGSSISGRALRIARQPLESRVLARRAGYDAALVVAQSMAVTIGGYRDYDGYKGFDLTSYAKGDLQHSIGNRPVFVEDPEELAVASNTFWKAAEQAKKAGVSLEGYLRLQGWSNDQIAVLELTQMEVVDGSI